MIMQRSVTVRVFWFFFFTIIIILPLFTGCSTNKIASSGFLSNYGNLREDNEFKGIYWWEKQGVNFKQYTKLIIDPVEVRIDENRSQRKMSKEETGALAARLRQYVVEEVKNSYPLTDQPAGDVLRIRSAITHLKPVNPALNIASAAIIFLPIDVGEVVVEAQFLDSSSGEILGELAAQNRTDVASLTTKVWTRWSQVDAAFREWAKILRGSLDESHR